MANTPSAFTVSGAAAGALVPLATLTASNSATLAFTSIFSSAYYQYLFLFNNILPATDNAYFYCQLGTGSSPTYVTTGYNVQINSSVGSTNASQELYGAYNNAEAFLSNITGPYGVDSTTGNLCGFMYLAGANGSSNPVSTTLVTMNYCGTNGYYSYSSGGWQQPAATFTAIKFYMSSGNITSGTVDCYGVKAG